MKYRRAKALFWTAPALCGTLISSTFTQENVDTKKDIEIGMSQDKMVHLGMRRPAGPQANPAPVISSHGGC